jgi:hypothetical protein
MLESRLQVVEKSCLVHAPRHCNGKCDIGFSGSFVCAASVRMTRRGTPHHLSVEFLISLLGWVQLGQLGCACRTKDLHVYRDVLWCAVLRPAVVCRTALCVCVSVPCCRVVCCALLLWCAWLRCSPPPLPLHPPPCPLTLMPLPHQAQFRRGAFSLQLPFLVVNGIGFSPFDEHPRPIVGRHHRQTPHRDGPK